MRVKCGDTVVKSASSVTNQQFLNKADAMVWHFFTSCPVPHLPVDFKCLSAITTIDI